MGSKYPGAEGRQVYVGNLSWEIGWQDLKVTPPLRPLTMTVTYSLLL